MSARKWILIAVAALALSGCRPDVPPTPSTPTAPSTPPDYTPGPNEVYLRKELPPVIAEDTATLTVAFPLKNDGDSQLIFTSVRKSCGCSDAELGRTTLNPGEETTLTVGLRLPGRFGPQRITC